MLVSTLALCRGASFGCTLFIVRTLVLKSFFCHVDEALHNELMFGLTMHGVQTSDAHDSFAASLQTSPNLMIRSRGGVA